MAYTYKKSKHLPMYPVNPFRDALLEKVEESKYVKKTWIKSAGSNNLNQLIINSETGETTGMSQFLTSKEVDPESFTKVYNDSFYHFFGLKEAGKRVLGYVLQIIKPNKDMFYLDLQEAKQYANYSNNRSISEGIVQLVEAQIIAKSSKGKYWYFINPMVLFNGDRLQIVIEYRKQVKEAGKMTDKMIADEGRTLAQNRSLDTKLEAIGNDLKEAVMAKIAAEKRLPKGKKEEAKKQELQEPKTTPKTTPKRTKKNG
jgi:hypothetical protein